MSGVDVPARVRFRDVLLAEVTKIVTVPACRWSLLAALVLNGALAAVELAHLRIATGEGIIGLREIGHLVLAPAYGIVAIAVFAAASEYPNGQIRVSLLAQPRRWRLFGAKLVAVAATVAAAACVCVLPAVVGAHSLDPAGALAWVGACVGLALVGFGLALMARGALIAFAVTTAAALADWTGILGGTVAMFLPHGVALAVLGMSTAGSSAVGPGAASLILTVWCVALLAGAALIFTRRDA